MPEYLEGVISEEYNNWNINLFPDRALYISSTVFPELTLKEQIEIRGEDEIFTCKGEIIGFRSDRENAENILKNLTDIDNIKLPKRPVDIIEFKNLWQIIEFNSEAIKKHFLYRGIKGEIAPTVRILNDKKIFIGANSVIEDYVVIDARSGPVYISEGVQIKSHSTIEGPFYLGPGSVLKPFTHICQGCSLGEITKAGGEISHSIILGFSNKQHYGFLGNSYLGKWVNLGAGTTNSNLKNNYSNIKLKFNNKIYDTDLSILGLLCGDHLKSAIGTLFNTGTVAGFGSNIFSGGLTEKFIPSFSWGHGSKYDLEKFIKTAEIVMSRREKTLSVKYRKMVELIFCNEN